MCYEILAWRAGDSAVTHANQEKEGLGGRWKNLGRRVYSVFRTTFATII